MSKCILGLALLIVCPTGCYNCSQRRINCDRGEPCQKCIKKGLQCSGLGIRYRFNDGVASRGRLAGKPVPVEDTGQDAAYADVLSIEAVLTGLCIGLVQTLAAVVAIYQSLDSTNSTPSTMSTANLAFYSTTVSLLPSNCL